MISDTERKRVALGLQPLTLGGWWFYLTTWSRPALWWHRRRSSHLRVWR